MPDTIPLPEMDALYNRLEKKVNVERQSEIDEFLRTHPTFDGKNPDGSTSFKLRVIEKTSNWNWRGQEVLAREISLEEDKRKQISRAKSEKTLKKLSAQALTSETRRLAEEKLSELITEAESERRRIFREIQSSDTREEARALAREAEESDILSEKTKEVLRKMAEEKVFL